MADSSVCVEVANLLPPGPVLHLEAKVRWLGEDRTIVLRDDGGTRGDAPRDSIWIGCLQGDAVRLLPVTLELGLDGGAGTEVWSAVEPLEVGDNRLVYLLQEQAGVVRAERVAAPLTGQPRPDHESDRVTLTAAWTVLVFLIVVYLVRGTSSAR